MFVVSLRKSVLLRRCSRVCGFHGCRGVGNLSIGRSPSGEVSSMSYSKVWVRAGRADVGSSGVGAGTHKALPVRGIRSISTFELGSGAPVPLHCAATAVDDGLGLSELSEGTRLSECSFALFNFLCVGGAASECRCDRRLN